MASSTSRSKGKTPRKKIDDYRYYRPNEGGQAKAKKELEAILDRLFKQAKKANKILALRVSHF